MADIVRAFIMDAVRAVDVRAGSPRQARDLVKGEPADPGHPYDGVRELLTFQTGSATIERHASKTLKKVASDVTNDLEKTGAWKIPPMGKNSASAVSDVFTAWTVAATRGRAATDNLGNKGVVDATAISSKALSTARTSAALWPGRLRRRGAGPRHRRDGRRRVARSRRPRRRPRGRHRLVRHARDEPARQPDGARHAEEPRHVLEQREDGPLAKLAKGDRPSLHRDLHRALTDWETEAAKIPKENGARLRKLTVQVGETLIVYRAMFAQLKSRDVSAQLQRTLDTIAAVMDTRLAAADAARAS